MMRLNSLLFIARFDCNIRFRDKLILMYLLLKCTIFCFSRYNYIIYEIYNYSEERILKKVTPVEVNAILCRSDSVALI